MDNLLNDMGQRLSKRRKQLGLTQEQLAEKAGISLGFLSQIEAPNLSVGISLAVHAGIVAWLKTTPLLSPKKAVCIALCLGMLDFLFVKLFPFPAQIMG